MEDVWIVFEEEVEGEVGVEAEVEVEVGFWISIFFVWLEGTIFWFIFWGSVII
jgi:hypothetical protein